MSVLSPSFNVQLTTTGSDIINGSFQALLDQFKQFKSTHDSLSLHRGNQRDKKTSRKPPPRPGTGRDSAGEYDPARIRDRATHALPTLSSYRG
jgi:hypothetical protein